MIEIFKNSESFKKVVLADYILPLVTINPKVLSSNSANLADMTSTTQGMTGTPWNHAAFLDKISFDELQSLGTDGETIDLLKVKNTQVVESQESDNPVALLLENQSIPDVRAIIDVGALFKKEKSNLAVAQKISGYFIEKDKGKDKKEIKYVLYFNEEDILCALDLEKNVNHQDAIIEIGSSDEKNVRAKLKDCPPEQRFTFYDQARITGADIKQAPNAHALVTLSETTTQSALLQGVKRMRAFTSGQNVTVIQPSYIKQRVLKKANKAAGAGAEPDVNINIENVLEFVNKNQAEKCLQIHLKGAGQKFKQVLRSHFLNIIYHYESDFFKKSEWCNQFEAIFTKGYKPEHFLNHAKVSVNINSKVYFENLEQKYFAQYAYLLQKSGINLEALNLQDRPEQIQVELKAVSEKAQQSCDSHMLSILEQDNASDLEQEVEKEKEKENEQERENEQEKEKEKENEQEHQTYDAGVTVFIGELLNHPNQFEHDDPDQVLRPNLEAIIHPNIILKGMDLQDKFEFDSNLLMTARQYKTLKNQEKYYEKKFIKPILTVMMVMNEGDPKSLTCIMLSNDKEEMGKLYQAKLPGKKSWFVSPQGSLMGGEPPEDTDPNKAVIQSQAERFLEQVRFINGEASLIAKQKKGITWLSERTKQKIKFLENTVLPSFQVQKKNGLKNLKSRLDEKSTIMSAMLGEQYLIDDVKKESVTAPIKSAEPLKNPEPGPKPVEPAPPLIFSAQYKIPSKVIEIYDEIAKLPNGFSVKNKVNITKIIKEQSLCSNKTDFFSFKMDLLDYAAEQLNLKEDEKEQLEEKVLDNIIFNSFRKPR